LSARSISKLKDLIIDHIGVAAGSALGSDSSTGIFNAIQTFSNGTKVAAQYTRRVTIFAPEYAKLLNGSFAHSYDYDDTYAAGTLHPGASITPAVLASAEIT
jgi:2-methylcitrate dehydratase PrpD